MYSDYDVFEILLNRSVKWQMCVRGKQRALDMLKVVGSQTFNECFAISLSTREIIGRVNSERIATQSIVKEDRDSAG